MTTVSPQALASHRRRSSWTHGRSRPSAQRGVVLIIALVMLVVVSLLTTLSIRSATSTEKVSGNVRTTELASQAAEIALRYCEDAVVQLVFGPVTFPATPDILDYEATPRWRDPANWDIAGTDAFIVPGTYVNQTGSPVTFNRPPECMVERMPVVTTAGAISTTSTYVITARGFGPEVSAADAARSRPEGSEVWMQSTIELE